MFPIVGILIVAVLIIIYEVPSLIKRKLHKELILFSLLLAFGVFISILESLDVELPNPSDWLTELYKPLTKIILDLLK